MTACVSGLYLTLIILFDDKSKEMSPAILIQILRSKHNLIVRFIYKFIILFFYKVNGFLFDQIKLMVYNGCFYT